MIIEINDIKAKKISIDYLMQRVEVVYNLTDSEQKSWGEGTAFFWATLPTPQPILDPFGNIIGTQELPENWYQLPQTYIDLLINMRNDAETAITARVLGG